MQQIMNKMLQNEWAESTESPINHLMEVELRLRKMKGFYL